MISFFAPVLLFAFSVFMDTPYQVDKRPMPVGSDFSKILPAQVGSFNRKSFTPPAPGLDGEATYTDGESEVFMLFSLAGTEADRRETMKTIYDEVKNTNAKVKLVGPVKTNPLYILFIGDKIAFFAWTRNKYCFSADAVGGKKEVLDAFMQRFPH